MKHLVLGSSGQIGFHLCNILRERGEEVMEFDIVNEIYQDLRAHRNILLEDYMSRCDMVYFLAFDIGGSLYMKKYQDTYQFISNNIKIMDNVFDSIKKHNVPFIFASSQMSNMSYSTYGLLKAIGEKYTEALNGIVVKFWNVYGYETDEEKSHVITDFIKMAKKGKINMRTDGKESRQFLYGDDCAECLISLLNNYENIDRKKPLHITSFEWNTIIEIADVIKSLIPCEVIPNTHKDTVQLDKRNEPNEYILNFWKPKTNLTEGIKKVMLLLNDIK